MLKVYTLTMKVTANADVNVADYMASRCRSHISLKNSCPVGELNCPFDKKSCPDIWGSDWKPLLNFVNTVEK